jgi:hypothetical protein
MKAMFGCTGSMSSRRLCAGVWQTAVTISAPPACKSERNNGAPSVGLYFAVIEAIERTLDRAEQRYADLPSAL